MRKESKLKELIAEEVPKNKKPNRSGLFCAAIALTMVIGTYYTHKSQRDSINQLHQNYVEVIRQAFDNTLPKYNSN